jgi:hypothetical protein
MALCALPPVAVLEQILALESGRILICRASSTERPETPWVKPYGQVRRAWASGPEESIIGLIRRNGSRTRVLEHSARHRLPNAVRSQLLT